MFKSHQLYSTAASITRKFLSNNNKATTEGISYTSLQYLYTGAQQTTLEVPLGTTRIVLAGIAMGGDGLIANDGSAPGGTGAGGGAANLAGYTINPASVYAGTTLYIGVGGPSAPRNTYVRTISHSGPVIFELNQGNTNGTGGAANPTYSSVAGGAGGAGRDRFGGAGGAGGSVTGSGGGGGGGGGGGDNSPAIPGGAGGPGGSVTMPATLLSPIDAGPTPSWTWGSPSSGGTGGTPGGAGGQAPGSGAFGGRAQAQFYAGGGGGGGAGVILNGASYGGGGGGIAGFSTPPTYPNPGSPPMTGSPGFLIVQLTNT